MEKHKTQNDLSICMKTLLHSVDDNDNNIQSGSISIVAEEHQNESNKEAYIPSVVSMGPRYTKYKEELLHMDEIKLRCMLSLLHRATKDGNIDEIIEKCNEVIWNLNDKIRASYVLDIEFERYELAKIMLVDGCFLLELLITKGFELDLELPSHLNITSTNIHSPFTLQVLKNDDVLSDLTLFENQIPMFIVHELSKILFPYFSEQNSKVTETKFNNIALSILGYSELSQDKSLEIKLHHLLDVVHCSLNNSSTSTSTITTTTTTNNNNNNNNPEYVVNLKSMTKLKLKRCATRLEAAGVSIQIAQNKGVRGLDFEFQFNEGKLEIAALIITKTTKAKWRNIIAWEHHKMDWKKSYSKGTNESEFYNTSGKFTSSALIFNDLICCTDDLKLLKEKNIIVDHTKMSNKELEEFIRTMSFGVDHGIVGSGYVEIVDSLNNYATRASWSELYQRVIAYGNGGNGTKKFNVEEFERGLDFFGSVGFNSATV